MGSVRVGSKKRRKFGFVESPVITVHVGVSTTAIDIVGTTEWAKVWEHIPAYNSKYEGDGAHLGDLRYLDTDIIRNPDGELCTMTLHIGTFDSERPRAGLTVFTLSVGTLEKPIETKKLNKPTGTPAYDKNWNFDKLEKGGVETEYKKPGTYDKETWTTTNGYTITDATKEGVESYIIPSPVVERRQYFSTRQEADNAARDVGKRKSPKLYTVIIDGNVVVNIVQEGTFGITGGDWLVMSVDVRKNADLWETITRFQFADEWDNDLYLT